jgi:hypothetical protein
MATGLELEFDEVRWESRLAGEEWSEAGTRITVPGVVKSTDWELKVKVFRDGKLICEKIENYRIVNEQKVELVSPGSGSRVEPGKWVKLEALVYDEYGVRVSDGLVEYYFSSDKVKWVKLNERGFMAPGEKGKVWLKVKRGRLEEVFPLVVRDKPLEREVAFSPGNLGPVGLKEDGYYYGFSKDHGDRGDEFFLVTWHGFVRRWTVALEEGSRFRWLAGKGEHRVKIVFGPVHRGEVFTAVVNGESVEVKTRRYNREVEMVLDVTADDGWIEISGDEGLPISRVIVGEPGMWDKHPPGGERPPWGRDDEWDDPKDDGGWDDGDERDGGKGNGRGGRK